MLKVLISTSLGGKRLLSMIKSKVETPFTQVFMTVFSKFFGFQIESMAELLAVIKLFTNVTSQILFY